MSEHSFVNQLINFTCQLVPVITAKNQVAVIHYYKTFMTILIPIPLFFIFDAIIKL